MVFFKKFLVHQTVLTVYTKQASRYLSQH